jgi:SAM-dependent methyltransferase
MELRELQSNWNEFGRLDPLWAILTFDDKRGGRWDEDEFFTSGRVQIAADLEYVRGFGLPRRWAAALDFGCGVGRLTQALADHFDTAVGVDIAPAMVAGARSRNRHGDRCRYVVNCRDDLAVVPSGSIDFLYSYIVLQHIRPDYILSYVREFVRVLAPGGCALFHVPDAVPADAAASRNQPPALPPRAFRAAIAPRTKRLTAEAGKGFVLTARVTNQSDVTWPAGRDGDQQLVQLACHWKDRNRKMVKQGDARGRLPHDLAPGRSADVTIQPVPPLRPGDYLLELDMAQDWVTWFADHGSPVATIRVRVTGDPAGPPPPEIEPRMEMYGVDWVTVVQTVSAAGGVVVDVRDAPRAHPNWRSFQYLLGRREG